MDNLIIVNDDIPEKNTQDHIASFPSVLFWVLKYTPSNQKEFDVLVDIISYLKENRGGDIDRTNLGIPQELFDRLSQHDYFIPIRVAIEDNQRIKVNYFVALFCMSLFDAERNKLKAYYRDCDDKTCEKLVLNWLVKYRYTKMESENGGIVVHYPFERNRPSSRFQKKTDNNNVVFISRERFCNDGD